MIIWLELFFNHMNAERENRRKYKC